MPRSLIVVALLLVAPLAAAQQIYKWTDAKGTVHYSQSAPAEGTRYQQVKLAGGVESADAPAPQPLVHALVWGLPPHEGELREGAIRPDGEHGISGSDVGRNSFLGEGWLPPDPPTGHGLHNYAFQLFALAPGPDVASNPGRGAVLQAMAGRVLAAGLLTGTYSRGEEAPIGPIGAPVTA